MSPYHVEVLFTEPQLAARVDSLAAEIVAGLPEDGARELLLVPLLKGAMVFAADLMRALSRHGVTVVLDVMQVSSYGGGQTSSGHVVLKRDLGLNPAGRPVLLIDDIADTGRTLDFVQRHLAERGAGPVTTAVLLDKPSRREVEVRVDHVGFEIPDRFVVGYGVDYAERHRELPFVGVVVEDRE